MLDDERGRVCACVAVDFPQAGIAELHRLYVRPDQRRRGFGSKLVSHVESFARRKGARHLFFWSDTRFSAAHRMYQRLGYNQVDGERPLGDISNTMEVRFERTL